VDRSDAQRRGDGAGEVIDAWVEDEHGLRTVTLERGRPCSVHVMAQLRQEAEDPILGFRLGNEHIPTLFQTSSRRDGDPSGHFEAGERVEMVARLALPLEPGRYSISPFVTHGGGSRAFMDIREGFASITLTGMRGGTGLVDMPHEVRIGRPAATEARE
jgi:hypothetical protein